MMKNYLHADEIRVASVVTELPKRLTSTTISEGMTMMCRNMFIRGDLSGKG